jgi:hypothetical protein
MGLVEAEMSSYSARPRWERFLSSCSQVQVRDADVQHLAARPRCAPVILLAGSSTGRRCSASGGGACGRTGKQCRSPTVLGASSTFTPRRPAPGARLLLRSGKSVSPPRRSSSPSSHSSSWRSPTSRTSWTAWLTRSRRTSPPTSAGSPRPTPGAQRRRRFSPPRPTGV